MQVKDVKPKKSKREKYMASKEQHTKKDDKKKAKMNLKEKRAKKAEKHKGKQDGCGY